MAEIVLFHHARGLTEGVLALAETWRRGGHTVHTPDLYDGQTFADLDSGLGYVRAVGFEAIIERGVAAASDLPSEVVLAGISLGVLPAQKLAQNRPATRGALLLEACIPVEEFGETWPASVPVQVHGMDADENFAGEDLDAARALVEQAADGELFLYPGNRHLFCDESLPAFDRDATELLNDRVLTFADRVGR